MLGEHVGFIRPYTITSQNSLLVDDKEQVHRHTSVIAAPLLTLSTQQEIFRKFNLGIYNLLIATKSVEDLDVPKAMIVIRFVFLFCARCRLIIELISYDLFEGDVSYAFIRSRTAGQGSHLVHMLERNNDGHRHILLSNSVLQHPDMIRWANILRCCPASAAPPRSLLPPRHSEGPDGADEEPSELCLNEPIAGGRICLRDAATVVYRLASTASANPFPYPLFEINSQSSTSNESPVYTCTVILPGTPAHNVTGQPCSSIAHARRSACYRVCAKLAEMGLLEPDVFLLPSRTTSRAQTSERIDKTQHSNSALYVGVQVYPRKPPAFWSNPTGTVTSLYPTVIVLHGSHQLPYAPILLITRRPFSKFDPFRLFFSGSPATIQTYKGAPFTLDSEKILALHMYTLRLCRAVANKAFICPLEDMPYFLAPLPASWTAPDRIGRWELLDVRDHIPWKLVALGALSWSVPLKYGRAEEVAEDIEDAVIQDRTTELTRRYDVLRVRADLSPLSHPEDSPVSRRMVTSTRSC
jgi:endoribonuclease Dicer